MIKINNEWQVEIKIICKQSKSPKIIRIQINPTLTEMFLKLQLSFVQEFFPRSIFGFGAFTTFNLSDTEAMLATVSSSEWNGLLEENITSSVAPF